METEDLLRVVNELDFICDDIDEIKARLQLTKSERNKIKRAITNVEKARGLLAELFPNIESLATDVREALESELLNL